MTNLFYSLISFIVALFFMIAGILAIMIPWANAIRSKLISFILEDALAISLFGFASFVIGLAIAINILLGTKRHYYRIRSTPSTTFVDENVIHQYLAAYWKQLFPWSDIPFRLTIDNNKFQIIADLPAYPKEEQKQLLERIKQDLTDTFAKVLGYHEDFSLAISFQKIHNDGDSSSPLPKTKGHL